MKVYLVEGGYDYERSDIFHVASTKELAEVYIKNKLKKQKPRMKFDYIEIREFEIDGPGSYSK